MKLTKTQIKDEIYRQFKSLIFEQVDDPQQQQADPYDKIKQLGELGKKIEQQIQNSLTHLNAFLNVGTKTQDSFEFKRAVAEISRIQKLTADYNTVIVKAHEIAESTSGEQPQPAIEAKKKPKPKPDDAEVVNKGGDKTIYETKPEKDDAELINKGGKDVYEGAMSQLAQEIDEIIERGEDNPQEIAKILVKRHPNYKLPWILPMVQGYLKSSLSKHESQYGIILKNRLDDSLRTVDIKAKSLKEAALLGAMGFPGWEIKHIIVKETVCPDCKANLLKSGETSCWKCQHSPIKKEGWADQNPEKCYTCQNHDLDEKDRCTGCKKNQEKCTCAGDYPERDDMRESYCVKCNTKHNRKKCPSCGDVLKRDTAPKKNEDLPAPRQGDQGSGIIMQPHQHELNDEKAKVVDAKGQSISVRDHVADQMWDEKKGQFAFKDKIRKRDTFRVEKIIDQNKIIAQDLQTGNKLTLNPSEIIRVGKSHAVNEEFDSWTCMECHYRSPKRFKTCPKCGSGEVENLG